jgi:UDP-N-acetylglucosamine:LPS N-acetylglucosamine transferase
MSLAKKRPIRILAVASAGGHWNQLLRLRPAFEGCKVHYVTTMLGLERTVADERISIVMDASRNEKMKLLLSFAQLVWIVLRFHPEVVVTTGAAPGILALGLGRLIGARTVWLDSIGNAEELSLSGRLALRYADLTLTQWPDLVEKYEGLLYRGKVL